MGFVGFGCMLLFLNWGFAFELHSVLGLLGFAGFWYWVPCSSCGLVLEVLLLLL